MLSTAGGVFDDKTALYTECKDQHFWNDMKTKDLKTHQQQQLFTQWAEELHYDSNHLLIELLLPQAN